MYGRVRRTTTVRAALAPAAAPAHRRCGVAAGWLVFAGSPRVGGATKSPAAAPAHRRCGVAAVWLLVAGSPRLEGRTIAVARVRDAVASDHAAVLLLNNAAAPHVNELSEGA